MDEPKCPLDNWTFKCPFVQWTLNTSVSYPQGVMLDRIMSSQQFWHCKSKMSHWTFKCPFIQWTNRNVHWILIANTLVSYQHMVRPNQITSLQLPWHCKHYMSHWTFKCPLVQWTNRTVHWTFKCPFVQRTSGHCLMANTLVSYPHGVILNHITSLQLLWHCKHYTCPLDINKCLFIQWTNRNV